MLRRRIYGFYKYQTLLKELVSRDIKVRYRRSFLGMIWTVLNPLLMMLVLSLVFSHIFQASIKNYPVYVLIGNIVFNLNSEASTQGMNSIVWNSSLIKKVYIPKYLFPLSNVMSSMVNFGFSFISLIIVMIFTHSQFYISLIMVPVALAYLFLFTLGLSLILCAVNVYFRDMQHLYSVAVVAWSYLTPLFYSIKIVPPELQKIILLNPMYHYVLFFREIIMDGIFPNIHANAVCLLMGLTMLVLGLIIFERLQDKFILHI